MFDLPTIPFESISLDVISIDAQLASDFLPTPNVACWILFLVFLARFFKVFSYAETPVVILNEHAKNKQTGEVSLKEVLSSCPILREK